MVDCEREVVIAVRAWKWHDVRDEIGVCDVNVAQSQAIDSK